MMRKDICLPHCLTQQKRLMSYGTAKAIAHKLGRKWIGVEMGEHFYTVVLPRMKKVLAYDKLGISKELKTPRQTSSATPLQEGKTPRQTPSATPLQEGIVFSTNAKNLKEIIATLKAEKQDKNLGEAFILNPEALKHLLLIPVYENSEGIFSEEKNPQKYPISRDDFDITLKYYGFFSDKIALENEIVHFKKVRFTPLDKFPHLTQLHTIKAKKYCK